MANAPELEWHLVFSDEDDDFAGEQRVQVSPFEDGAVLSSRSLLLVVKGREVRQDPKWLVGLPEYLNWGWWVVTALRSPTRRADAAAPELPSGTELVFRAGFLGASRASLVDLQTTSWNGERWTPPVRSDGGSMDSRLRSLAGRWQQVEYAALPGGELFAVGSEKDSITAYALPASSDEGSWSTVPSHPSGWQSAQIGSIAIGNHIFCARRGAMHTDDLLFRFRRDRWTAIEAPPGRIRSCTATSDGTFWVLLENRRLFRLEAESTRGWLPVSIPQSTGAYRIDAAGDRLWLTTESEVYSSSPVERPVFVSARQTPFADEGSGYRNARRVSDSPAGPGTSACPSLLVHLGFRSSEALRDALARNPDIEEKSLLHVDVSTPGSTIRVGQESSDERLRYLAGRGRKQVVFMTAEDLDDALRIVTALAPHTDVVPKIVCDAVDVSGGGGFVAGPKTEPYPAAPDRPPDAGPHGLPPRHERPHGAASPPAGAVRPGVFDPTDQLTVSSQAPVITKDSRVR